MAERKTMAEEQIVGGEPVRDTCPECGSAEQFYHCWPHCRYPTLVTCINCGCPYKTNKSPPPL